MKEKEIPKSCAQCRHFHQHYVRVAGYRYAPLDEGHCMPAGDFAVLGLLRRAGPARR